MVQFKSLFVNQPFLNNNFWLFVIFCGFEILAIIVKLNQQDENIVSTRQKHINFLQKLGVQYNGIQ